MEAEEEGFLSVCAIKSFDWENKLPKLSGAPRSTLIIQRRFQLALEKQPYLISFFNSFPSYMQIGFELGRLPSRYRAATYDLNSSHFQNALFARLLLIHCQVICKLNWAEGGGKLHFKALLCCHLLTESTAFSKCPSWLLLLIRFQVICKSSRGGRGWRVR